MKDERPPRSQIDRWWSLQLTARDIGDAGFEERERGPEAEARHLAYVQNAYATLSPTREIVRYGARAGLQVGAAVLAVETALLIAIIAAALSVSTPGGAGGTLYGQTPLAGTFLEPLWPVVVTLPVLPVFALIGAVAALMRRVGNRRRRALDKYFNPVSPRLDFVAFWLLITSILMWAAYVLGLMSTQTDPTGLLTLALCAAGLIAWPCHRLWLLWYLPLIHARGSASMDEIRARIQRQL
jgi:hypothetical protein